MQMFFVRAWLFFDRLFNPALALATTAEETTGSIDDTQKAIMEVLNPVINLVTLVLRLLGGAFAIWGVVQLVIALKNDREPDAIAKAIVTLAIGVILAIAVPILIGVLLPKIGIS